MKQDVRNAVDNQFWTRQMLEFIHPRYSLSKYERTQGICSNLKDNQQKQCINNQKTKVEDMMIFAQYYKNKNTKCMEQGLLSGYDWKFVQKTCWQKVTNVMQNKYPLTDQQKSNFIKLDAFK